MSTDRPKLADTAEFASPPSFQATSVTVSLTARDLPASIGWYCDVVGFEVEQRMERDGALRSAVLRAGAVRLVLNQEDGARGWDRQKGEGFSITLNTSQRIDEVARRIREHGGTLASEPADMPWGVRMFRLVDPDGYRLSISMPIRR